MPSKKPLLADELLALLTIDACDVLNYSQVPLRHKKLQQKSSELPAKTKFW